MSLILEALRKSEAERRRGQTPDVLAEMPVAQPVARHAWRAWFWLLPAAIVLLAALWLAQRTGTPSTDVATAAPATKPATTKTQTPSPALPPVPRLEPAPTVAREAIVKAPAVVDTPGNRTRTQISPPETPAETTPQQPAPTPSIASAIRTTPAPVAAGKPMPIPPPTAPVATARNTIESLSDLSAADRESLPPLKLSMHLWNADPARRFVIIDGSRVGEGDRVGDAVIRTITPDGVVIDWRGRQIKLPIR